MLYFTLKNRFFFVKNVDNEKVFKKDLTYGYYYAIIHNVVRGWKKYEKYLEDISSYI